MTATTWNVMATGFDDAEAVTFDPDWELVARLGRGDRDALGDLVRRHERRVATLCHRFLDDRDEALDATQEVFLKAWRQAANFEPRARVTTWLHRIAVNHCLNRLRRRAILRFVPFVSVGDDGQEEVFDPVDPVAGPDGALDSRRELAAVRRAIRRLPPGQRAVLVLVRFEGLSYRATAEALGITEGAVESRLVRAMRTLTAARQQVAAKLGTEAV